ncbi:tetratricopeptide repeat protein [Candidatus Methylacidithermus pantelleriae]|uniref:Tetratricopeptide repeat protein n=1 Tax=Candidatus Methylacidithermus pantelleriae TaxID=2744239 RepID=A0A8J2BRE0_9BACT|nr:tetratricopeptide repeat protein [Candidatus Methylacidithermus pantelleriae]CAF0693564.1 hypothetical protein MPNT_140044 [Candidatus Methylacidithermus pantelleriae]
MAKPASVEADESSAPLAWFREALTLLEGAAFFFVVDPAGGPPVKGKEALGRILGGRPLVEVRVSPEAPLDLNALKEQLEQNRGSVVLLDAVDLEWADLEVSLGGTLAERVERAQRVLQDLNMKRDALARLGAPVVFWVTPAGLRAFSLWAADLFSANSGVFEIAPAPSPSEGDLLWEPWIPASRHRNLPEAEVRGRIRFYERQLEGEARKRTPHRPLLAGLHTELAFLYGQLGDHLRALEHQQKAVNLHRELAEENPQAFLPSLATSLNNLGTYLSALGQREEALAATQEAVDLYRKLAAQNPQAFLCHLASSLTNLGGMFANLGRWQEGLAATQEAVQLYRKLVMDNSQAFLPDLAMSLTNLGTMLANLGRREEALAVVQEALGIRHKLAAQNPQVFLPALAASLATLGNTLAKLGRWWEALEPTQQAVDFYRKLASQNPQIFLPALAASLKNLGTTLVNLGRGQEALAATQEAVDLLRKLASQNPQVFLPALVASLTTLGTALAKLGRKEEAAAVAQEVEKVRSQLA